MCAWSVEQFDQFTNLLLAITLSFLCFRHEAKTFLIFWKNENLTHHENNNL